MQISALRERRYNMFLLPKQNPLEVIGIPLK